MKASTPTAISRKTARFLVLIGLLAATLAAQSTPGGDRWLTHLTQDLLPFWTVPDALGTPLGLFPSTRCDDGSLLKYASPCPPIAGNPYLLANADYLVTLSRQTYGYGVAYHLTGDPKYLGYMKAGVAWIRRNWVDRTGGGMFTTLDLKSQTWGPQREFRNAQELGYGLLGLSFYYYLTRDAEVLPDILAIKNYVIQNYWNAQLGAMQWTLATNGSDRYDRLQLVSDLDQMNTYLVLLAPVLPEPEQSEWKQTLGQLSRSILGIYYSPADNLLFTAANTPQDTDGAATGVDLGHTSKGFWIMRFAGLMTGDLGLVRFAESSARRHLERSYLPEDGAWAGGVLPGGQLDKDKNWWVYAELDQLSGTLALDDPGAGRYLATTADYWFRYFVDQQAGEVWNGVNYGTNTPQRDFPKQWQWKSAYHSFEHALAGYITGRFLESQPAVLHYAFQQAVDPAQIQPYYFLGKIAGVIETADSAGAQKYQAVSFVRQPPAAQGGLRVVNGASLLATPVAAGASAAAFGSRLALETQAAGAEQITAARVEVTDAAGSKRQARVIYASPGQVNFVVPAEATSGTAQVTITAQDGSITVGMVDIAAVSPGLFSLNARTALAAANAVRVRADGSQSAEAVFETGAAGELVARPVDVSSATERVYLTLWGSGFRKAQAITVSAGGLAVPVTYWGAVGTAAADGLDQLNIGPLPRALAGHGRVNIIIAADGQTANPVQIAVK